MNSQMTPMPRKKTQGGRAGNENEVIENPASPVCQSPTEIVRFPGRLSVDESANMLIQDATTPGR